MRSYVRELRFRSQDESWAPWMVCDCEASLREANTRFSVPGGHETNLGRIDSVAGIMSWKHSRHHSKHSFNTFASLIPARYIRSLTTGMFLLW
jgi:hypothetical protein